jgi:hypothetical protein
VPCCIATGWSDASSAVCGIGIVGVFHLAFSSCQWLAPLASPLPRLQQCSWWLTETGHLAAPGRIWVLVVQCADLSLAPNQGRLHIYTLSLVNEEETEIGSRCSASSRISKGQGYQGFLRKRAGSSFGQKRAICVVQEKTQNNWQISLLLGSIKCFPISFNTFKTL